MNVLLAPMEGLLDYTLRDILTRVGGVDRCVSEFIRITDQVLPARVFTRIVPELQSNLFADRNTKMGAFCFCLMFLKPRIVDSLAAFGRLGHFEIGQ